MSETSIDWIQSILTRYIPAPSGAVTEQTSLGPDGLGLDSISIAEVLLDIQDQRGVEMAVLLDGSDITIGRILDRLRDSG